MRKFSFVLAVLLCLTATAANNGYMVVGQQIASNTQSLGQFSAVGGSGDSPANATRYESRIRMTMAAGTTATNIRLVFPSFYLAPIYTVAPSSFTVEAGVEYNGTTTMVLFGGASNITLNSQFGYTTSDPINPGIPAGATFYVRTGVTMAAGATAIAGYQTLSGIVEGVLSTNASSQISSTGDLTLGATGVSHNAYGPMAVLGKVTGAPKAALIIGDSILDSPQDASGNQGYVTWGLVAATVPPSYIRVTRSAGQIQYAYPTSAPMIYVMEDYTTHLICELGVNDLAQSGSGTYSLANIEANVLSIWASAKANGLKVYEVLITPFTTSTDSWATAGNQTITNTRFQPNGDRDTFNTWIKARVADGTIDGYIDPNTVVEDPSNHGKWVTNGTAGYSTTDGLHPTLAFKQSLAPLVTAIANSW